MLSKRVSNTRTLLLAAVLLVPHLFVQVHAQRNITIPTPTSEAGPSNSSIANVTVSGSIISGNITATASGNSTSSNATRTTSSTPDPTKPFATDFQTQTYRVPAPAAAGGGDVAQSPDDSYIAKAERTLAAGLMSVIIALASVSYLVGVGH